MRRITKTLICSTVGVCIGCSVPRVQPAPTGEWSLLGLQKRESKRTTAKGTGSVLRFSALNTKTVLSLEYGPERCIEAIGYVQLAANRLKISETGIARAAVGCNTEPVPVLFELAQDLRKGVKYNQGRNSIDLIAEDGTRYILAPFRKRK